MSAVATPADGETVVVRGAVADEDAPGESSPPTIALSRSHPSARTGAELTVRGRADYRFTSEIALNVLRHSLACFFPDDCSTSKLHTRPPLAGSAPLQENRDSDPGEAPRATATAAPLSGEREVMTADDVALFLGVDRNTVYDYANRGVIPHRRLGKRLLFSRAGLVAWLETSCKAASTRKG